MQSMLQQLFWHSTGVAEIVSYSAQSLVSQFVHGPLIVWSLPVKPPGFKSPLH